MRYWLVFGSIAAALSIAGYVALDPSVEWAWYWVWAAAVSVATFLVYGLDKGLAKGSLGRAPEGLLNLLAIVGGAPGAWLGMVIWHHKTNVREHWDMWLVLGVATLGYLALGWVLLFKNRG